MSSMVGDRLNPAVAAQLKGKRVLVTNDDGIDADGLARLEALARRYCDDVWVIAPATHQSARSRGITLRTPLRVVELGERRAAVTGTPLDTFMVGMQHFFDDRLPDLVLSGINHGGNTGADIGYSGTCGIVMEAAMHGIRGIAFSQHTVGGFMDWSVADAHLNRVFDQVMQVSVPDTIPLSVNFPAAMAQETGAEACWSSRRASGKTRSASPPAKTRKARSTASDTCAITRREARFPTSLPWSADAFPLPRCASSATTPIFSNPSAPSSI